MAGGRGGEAERLGGGGAHAESPRPPVPEGSREEGGRELSPEGAGGLRGGFPGLARPVGREEEMGLGGGRNSEISGRFLWGFGGEKAERTVVSQEQACWLWC